MGTSDSGAGGGSGGSSGGAGGGGGGAGGGGGGAGFVELRNGSLREVDPNEKEAWDAIQGVFSRLTPDYIGFLVGDEGVRAAYETIQWLHIILAQDKSWAKIEDRFHVAGTSGCVRALIDALCRDQGEGAVNPLLRAPLKAALMDFFLQVLGDPVVRDAGDAKEVLRSVKPKAFESASALFLGAYLTESLRQEEKNLSRLARNRLKDFALAKANQVVGVFKERFHARPWKQGIEQVSYTHLFRIMKEESEWLIAQLRRNVPPQAQA
jgi:hypothetical protein